MANEQLLATRDSASERRGRGRIESPGGRYKKRPDADHTDHERYILGDFVDC